jgi:hypothetical protein
VINLPAPSSKRAEHYELDAADLAKVVRLYALRSWIEQGYKQLKYSLGWAQYQEGFLDSPSLEVGEVCVYLLLVGVLGSWEVGSPPVVIKVRRMHPFVAK